MSNFAICHISGKPVERKRASTEPAHIAEFDELVRTCGRMRPDELQRWSHRRAAMRADCQFRVEAASVIAFDHGRRGPGRPPKLSAARRAA